ncbi:hypothetical protein [Pedobacter sp. R20-19]|uniref:hypothetical protein n=1 Tax=Pedobacter sp. R20-19 TaxID=1270196 RepID=UPI0018D10D98|nr:hypothetical protein [Pedobacter sp. R20-19]
MERFEPSKFNMLAPRIEVLGIKNLNKSIKLAKEVIAELKPKLVISHCSERAIDGSFEVICPLRKNAKVN